MSEQSDEIWVILRELSESQKKTEQQMRKTDEQMRNTDKKLNRIGDMVDGIGKNQGFVAGEFFFNSLLEDTHLGSIYFDDMSKNGFKHRGTTQEEYDIVMTNGNVIGIVDVKYKAHEKDLDKLEGKMRNFKTLFPWFKDYKLYGAIASFHIYEDAKKVALERGFFVLQRSGKVITTEAAENLLVLL
jgi:hypothetical protein